MNNRSLDVMGEGAECSAQPDSDLEESPIWRDRPTVDQERLFQIEELFFSITDKKGVISFANDIFTRISAYAETELLHQPHNIIRHPDIPRAVFFVLWDFLKKDKAVAAYVKNRAKDGCYYWVMALVFPCAQGYISIRLKPGSPIFETIQRQYADVLAYEREQMARQGRNQGMMAAVALLQDRLATEGFESYDQFMWVALESEMRNREQALIKAGYTRQGGDAGVPENLLQYEDRLSRLFEKLSGLKQLHEQLIQHSEYLLQLSWSIRVLALNAQIGTARLEDGEGDALSAVAGQMGDQSMGGAALLSALQDHVSELSRLLHQMNFDIIIAKLQVEMSACFIGGLHAEEGVNYAAEMSVADVIKTLQEVYEPNLVTIAQAVGRIPDSLNDLRQRMSAIGRFLYVLRFVYITGKIEVARLADAGEFANTFNELIREVGEADKRLKELSAAVEVNQRMTPLFLESERVLSAAATR